MTTILLLALTFWAPQGGLTFSREDARILVQNAPMVVEHPQQCIQLSDEPDWSEGIVHIVVRDTCSRAASDLVGYYSVDLATGDVYYGPPFSSPLRSERLEQVRKDLLAKKAK
jgi:hypothetical protein